MIYLIIVLLPLPLLTALPLHGTISVNRNTLYEMFPTTSREGIDKVHQLAGGNSNTIIGVLLNPAADKLLTLLSEHVLTGETAKCPVDEDDLFSDALAFYKCEKFDPSRPIRVIMRTQPAVDTGGIRRQFFTDVLHHFAHKDTKAMFVGPQERLRPDYSSQVEPFMKILGTIIVHSLLQEGPGFPYLSPYIYWYLVTGCDETAISYITPIDLTPSVAEIVHCVSMDIFYTVSKLWCIGISLERGEVLLPPCIPALVGID